MVSVGVKTKVRSAIKRVNNPNNIRYPKTDVPAERLAFGKAAAAKK